MRMVMVIGEHGLTLTVNADRPETLDLMRRHIDTLAQDFAALGYRDLSFSFAGSGQGHAAPGGEGPLQSEPVDDSPSAGPARAMAGLPTGLDGRLDIRL
ncbi:MAG: flagellar hook-length control protein FliK [Rhodobacteraceae bacterium]|nr:flagellar hook-length control protein FliK [Paracoccaceae bacterium]